jgi:hypothetical protein
MVNFAAETVLQLLGVCILVNPFMWVVIKDKMTGPAVMIERHIVDESAENDESVNSHDNNLEVNLNWSSLNTIYCQKD